MWVLMLGYVQAKFPAYSHAWGSGSGPVIQCASSYPVSNTPLFTFGACHGRQRLVSRRSRKCPVDWRGMMIGWARLELEGANGWSSALFERLGQARGRRGPLSSRCERYEMIGEIATGRIGWGGSSGKHSIAARREAGTDKGKLERTL